MTMPWHSKASSFCPISHKCPSCCHSCLCVHNPGMERTVLVSAGTPSSSSTALGISAGDRCVHLLSQGSDPSHISAAIQALFTALLGASQEPDKCKGRAQCLSHSTTNALFSPGGHRSHALVLQVQQPGHSSFLTTTCFSGQI